PPLLPSLIHSKHYFSHSYSVLMVAGNSWWCLRLPASALGLLPLILACYRATPLFLQLPAASLLSLLRKKKGLLLSVCDFQFEGGSSKGKEGT
ncbi:unnamed protein product, partial [Urochloa humidicola]